MIIVKPSHKHLDCSKFTAEQFIEKIGRTCYKSEDKITDTSAEAFVRMLAKNKHWAMLEHGTVYMLVPIPSWTNLRTYCSEQSISLAFIKHSSYDESHYIVSGSFRSFRDLFVAYLDLMEKKAASPHYEIETILSALYAKYPVFYEEFEKAAGKIGTTGNTIDFLSRIEIEDNNNLPDSTKMRHLTHTVLFVCDRGVSHELVRHRPCSFAQESTRYCNYGNDKHGNQITVIEPFFYAEPGREKEYEIWKKSCEVAEKSYMDLLAIKRSPQEARSVLPNSLKTEIIMTATEDEWQHIINLRAIGTTGAPHPQMKEIMLPWSKELAEITNGRIFAGEN